MSERSPEQIRREIADERQALAGDLVVLQGEARRVTQLALGGLAAALVLVLAAKLLWRLR